MDQVALIVNSNSRRGALWFQEAQTALASRGFDLALTTLCKRPAAMLEALNEAKRRSVPIVAVGGGDGTLRSAAKFLAHSPMTLGALPMGTGNAFARDLGIATDLQVACDVIAAGHSMNVDLGVVNGNAFLNVATIGLSTLIARNLDARAKRGWGPLAYIGPLVRAIRQVRPFEARLVADGVDESMTCFQLAIGNGRFHAGPFPLPGDASLQTGRLVVYAVAVREKRALIRYMLDLALGRLDHMDDCRVYQLQRGRVETFPPRSVTVDGDIVTKSPIEFSVDPGALRVFAPAEET